MREEHAQGYVDVLRLDELPPGTQHVHKVGLTRILICHTQGGELFAVIDVCPHARQPLAGGAVSAGSITCPKHGARFDLQSGAPLNRICNKPLQTLDLRVRDERIEVRLPSQA